MGFEDLFADAVFGSMKAFLKSTSLKESIEAEEERKADLEIRKQILLSRCDPYAPKELQPYEQRAIDSILSDYPDFDFNLAKSAVQTVAEMMAKAFQNHPKDYSNFGRLCSDKAVMKIRRITLEKRYHIYENNAQSIEITRYNPDEAQPTVMMKTCIMFGDTKPMYFFFFYSCFDDATACPHCGGIIENAKRTTTCPFCNCAVTTSATEKAWKITDVRRL